MNRIEKKCLLGSAVLHGMVALTVLFSTAFSGRKAEEYVTVVPLLNLKDIVLTDDKTSGGSSEVAAVAPSPAPSQPVVQQPVQPPVQTPPPPVQQRPETSPPQPVEPAPAPPRETARVREPDPEIRVPNPKELRNDVRNELPVRTDSSKKKITLDPVDRSTSKTKAKEAPARPAIDLGKVVKRDTAKVQQEREDRERTERIAAENAARRQAEQRRNALANAVRGAGTAVQVGTGSKTSIELIGGPGGGGPAALNYDQYIVAEFTRNWNLPSTLRDDSLIVKARVTIASDGRVVSASISSRSGDSALDRSVESVLQRVKQVRGFPSGVSSENRTYTIKFKPEFNLGSG